MTYKEYREQQEKEMNELPIFWAFTTKQLEEEMNKRGLSLKDTDKIYRFGNGGFYLRSDAQQIRDYFNKPNRLSDLMKDYNFAYDAILYEMNNHEYAINWQADWDVCSAFGKVDYTDADDALEKYFDRLKWEDSTRKAYADARREHYKAAQENNWF